MNRPALSDLYVCPGGGGRLRQLLGSTSGRNGSLHATAVLRSRGGECFFYDAATDAYLLFSAPVWSL